MRAEGPPPWPSRRVRDASDERQDEAMVYVGSCCGVESGVEGERVSEREREKEAPGRNLFLVMMR